MNHDEYMSYDAVGLAELIRKGECTAQELTEIAISLSERINPILNALAYTDYDRARERVGTIDPESFFCGVPSFLKDNENVEGLPTRQGSHSMPPTALDHDSPFVKQYLSTGLNYLGKTTLPEFGLTCITESSLCGNTLNPWNLAHTPGGSSGGTAALVAAGVVPMAQGNDGGGSIRIPASCCNLIGLKPSRGRLHHAEGTDKMPINLVCEGVLTRSVRDTATFFSAAEKHLCNPNLPALGLVNSPGTKRLRIAMFTKSPAGDESQADVMAATEQAAKLCENLGHTVEAIETPFDNGRTDDFLRYWGAIPYILSWIGKREFGSEFDSSKFDPWTAGLARHGRKNLWRLPFILRKLKQFCHEYSLLFEKYDILLCPVLTEPPLKVGELAPDLAYETQLSRVMPYCPFTPFQNVAGTPAISLPLGRSQSGLPIGIQFAANMGMENMLLELAYELEEANAWDTTPAIVPV